MRLNRLAQIGLIVIAAAVLLWVVLSRSGNRNTTTTEANAANTGNVTNVSTNPQSAPPRSSGRGYKARIDIPARTIITRDMFQEGSLSDSNDDLYVTDFLTEGYGYVTAKPILRGRHLQHSDLLGSVRDLGVSAAIQDGYRAITIAVPNKATLHDIVSIGDFVDVVATFDQAETRVLADGVRVLAVDVFGRDYEKAPVAKRGNLSGGPNAPARPDPNATPVPGQPPVPEGEPAPTPVPQGQQQPPAAPREAALTLEVRPEQATAISFATASGAVLDYLIQPRPNSLAAPQTTQARLTKAQIAPYALASKRSGGATTNTRTQNVSTGGGGGGRGSRDVGSYIPMPNTGNIQLPPATLPPPMATPKPKTYDIVIYPDGLPPRVNTVPIPD